MKRVAPVDLKPSPHLTSSGGRDSLRSPCLDPPRDVVHVSERDRGLRRGVRINTHTWLEAESTPTPKPKPPPGLIRLEALELDEGDDRRMHTANQIK